MPNYLDWRGFRYLLPNDCKARYIILPGGPNGSNVLVLERQRHEDGTISYSVPYVPMASSALTVEHAESIFVDTCLAERTDYRIPNPRIGR